MAQPKRTVSLTSSLLARKGTARPAMRPQDLTVPSTDALDDLGWNDMGTAPPPVLVERAALKVEIERPVAIAPVSAATAARIGRESLAKAKGAKVAFTLRLETERHLRLRLASAVTGRSAQYLVTQALDAFLNSLPEVDALVAQLPPAKRKC
ncbi:conserved hypothetical protein [Sphingomonas aurantiaca]|uniref:Uncharacterized protein n=1 Tax=Sphingomonas aurantiaca TaxID=185949 RepID=A0A5E7YVY1_9SPHN|nr:hypothetical protein [Sphingomonas aurantiaca]VVT10576.1 conserved hypothetical protein [Sphingomonas aurantiaca]